MGREPLPRRPAAAACTLSPSGPSGQSPGRRRRVVVAADYFRLAGLPRGDPRRVEIVNGVDAADFAGRRCRARPTDRFVLSFTSGRSTASATRRPPCAYWRLWPSAAQIDAERIEVRLVGSLWIPDFAPPPGIRVEKTGYVTTRAAVAEMCAATALLLYVPSSSLAPSGKLFEYLASGRPLLCLARAGQPRQPARGRLGRGRRRRPGRRGRRSSAQSSRSGSRWQDAGLADQEQVRAQTSSSSTPARRDAARLAEVLDEAARG